MCNPSLAQLSAAALSPRETKERKEKEDRKRKGTGARDEGMEGTSRVPWSAGRGHLLIEEHAGAHDELEDVLQSLHGLVQLLVDARLLGIVHVVP